MSLATRVVAIGCAALLISCGGEGGSGASPSDLASTPVTETATSAAALEGTWRTGTVTQAQIEQTLRDEGLEAWIEPLRAFSEGEMPVASSVLILELRDGRWDLFRVADSSPREPIDYDARYEVDGDTVTATHEGDFNRYRWTIDDDTLTLEWLETNYPDNQGIPEQVLQTALYMSSPFERTD